MKRLIRIKTVLLIILMTSIITCFSFFTREQILLVKNRNDVREIIQYCMDNGIELLCVANVKGDGSESLIQEIPMDLRENFKRVINSTMFMCGPESRIYCWVDIRAGYDHIFVVSTSKRWKNSIFYWGNIDYSFKRGDFRFLQKWTIRKIKKVTPPNKK